jgi:hypothetical protein
VTSAPAALDPAIATALRDQTTPTAAGVTLDPAIQTALLERAPSPIRPDDRPELRGVGSLPQPEPVLTSDATDWSAIGASVGAAFATLLVATTSLIAVRRRHARTTNP